MLRLAGPVELRSFTTYKTDGIDWREVRLQRNDELWRDLFGSLPHIDWNADPHAHWQKAHQDLTDRLREMFPKPARQPRRNYVSFQAWAIRKQRILHRRAWRNSHADALLHQLHLGFSALRHGHVQGSVKLRCFMLGIRALLAGQQLSTLATKLKKQIRTDKLDFLAEIADQAAQDPKFTYQTLRKAGFGSQRRKKSTPLPCITNSQGEPCTTIKELQDAWLTHFAEVEGGFQVAPDELLQLCQHDDLKQERCPGVTFAQIPSLKEVEDSLRRCALHKAAGTDGIVPETCHYAARWMARWIYPLFAKSAIYGNEPIQFKGGILHSIWKKKGSMTDPTAYRGILVSAQLAKVFHNVFRRRAISAFQVHAEPLQCGGLPGKSVSHAAHACRLQQSLCHQNKYSCAVLFVDIKNAYYRLLRELAIETSATKEQLHLLLRRLELPDESLIDILQALREQPNATTAMEMEPLAKYMAGIYHSNTWFHIRGAPQLAKTLQGTRPGDGWADLLFNVVVTKVVQSLKQELQEQGLQFHLAWNGIRGAGAGPGEEMTTEALASIWADDMAFMLQSENPKDLIHNLTVTTALLHQKFASRGLILNMSAGKTEAVVHLRGPGSTALRRQYFSHTPAMLEVEAYDGQPLQLRMVQSYVHLGGTLHAKGRVGPELRRRLAIAKTAFNQHRASVYQQTQLPVAKRAQLFEACILSAAFYNAGTWTEIAPPEWKSFEHGIVQLYRRILAKDVPHETLQHWSVSQLLQVLELPHPADLLRYARLRYYGSVLRNGPDALWGLIGAEKLWLQAVRKDIVWLHEQTPRKHPRPHPEDDPNFWDDIALNHPGQWKGLLKKARQRRILQCIRTTYVATWHERALQDLADQGIRIPLAPISTSTAKPPSRASSFPCLKCKMAFATKAAWAVHCFRKHGRHASVRYLADGRTCDICGKLYLSTFRLNQHLRYSDQCAKQLAARGVYNAPLPSIGSRIWQQEELDDRCPWLYTEGPRLLPRHLAATTLSSEQEDFFNALCSLEEEAFDCDYNPSTFADDWTMAVYQLCLETSFGLDALDQTLSYYLDFFEFRFPQRIQPAYVKEFLRVVVTIKGMASTEFFLPGIAVQKSTEQPIQEDYEARLRRLDKEALAAHIGNPLMLPRYSQPIFLHLYSGHRREGDLQAQLENIDWSPRLRPIIVSLDLQVDASRCNMMDSAQQEFWLKCAKEGKIDGGLGGPPCETWSAARHFEEIDYAGPRPVRLAEALWGLNDLAPREERQVHVANVLLLFTILLQLYCWIAGRWFVLEHPKEPDPAEYASIWRLPIMRLLLGLPGYRRFLIYQGLYGGLSPKPTHLLFTHAPANLDVIALRMRTTSMPAAVKMGRVKGERFYRTAALKEYPPSFCAFLAQSYYAWSCEQTETLGPQLAPTEIAQFQKLEVSLAQSATIFGPDYAGP